MKALTANLTRALNVGSVLVAADNSGALLVRITGVKHGKVVRGRQQYAKLADHVKVSVVKGLPDMKGKVFDAVVVRVRRPYQRLNGERISFIDNAAVLLKDERVIQRELKLKDQSQGRYTNAGQMYQK